MKPYQIMLLVLSWLIAVPLQAQQEMDHSGHDMSAMDHSGHDMGDMDHSGHQMAPQVTTGPWSYHDRDNPKPHTRNRWEMTPVPGYGHMYVNDRKLSQSARCDALRNNPRVMVDRATRQECGLPLTPAKPQNRPAVPAADMHQHH